MAYGYNDGDQRRQSVRLAGRTTPTPRRATSSNPQRPQEQPRPSSRQQTSRTRQSGRPSTGTSAQQDSRWARALDSVRPRFRNCAATAHVSPASISTASFASPRRTRRQALPLDIVRECPRPVSSSTSPHTVLYPHLSGLCAYELLYVPRLSRPRSNRRGQAAQGPSCARLLVCVFDPAFAVASRHHAHIYQIDPAWSELPYAGGTIRQMPRHTCLTMVYIYKTGHTDMTPVDMCALSEAGNYAPTGATEWSFMTSGAWQLVLNGTELHIDQRLDDSGMRSGAPVIAAVRPGTFTNVGHYIVLYGIDDRPDRCLRSQFAQP